MRLHPIHQLLQKPFDEAYETIALAHAIRAKQRQVDQLVDGKMSKVIVVPQGVYPDFAGVSKIRGQFSVSIFSASFGKDVIDFVERPDGYGGQIVDFGETLVNDAQSVLQVSLGEEGFSGQPFCLWTVVGRGNPVHRDFELFLKALAVWPNTARQQIIRSDAKVPSLLKALPFCLSTFQNGCVFLGLPHATFEEQAEALTAVFKLFNVTKGYEPKAISIARVQERYMQKMNGEIEYLDYLFRQKLDEMKCSSDEIQEIHQRFGLRGD